MILFTIYDLFTKMLYDGDERKTPKSKKKKKQYEIKEKILRLVAFPSPLLRNGGRLFSGVQKHRKQAGQLNSNVMTARIIVGWWIWS